jgi:polyhydroxybutyrate depolymerase
MKTKIILLAFCSLFFSTTFFSQSTINGSFTFQSRLRSYILYVPAIYNPSVAVPLVMNFHGYTSNSSQQLVYGDFRPIADTANFIIVCPNGTLDQSNQQYWNNYDVPGGPDDIAFTNALIDTISAHYNIDQHCIYSTGMSNGAIMSYDLAYKLSYRIAAIASVAGSMIYSHMAACNPIHPTPVMEIHGTADGTVLYNGDMYFEPVDSLQKFWINFNHCSTTPIITNVPDINTSDGCTADHYVYSGGDSGVTVELFKINGGGHSWPGAPVNINITNMDFNASVEIWRFFRQYKLNQLSNGISENENDFSFSVYPNPSEGNFNLNFSDNSEKTITVTNSLGQVIQSFKSYDQATTIYLENAGMYFVTVSSAKNNWTQKIIRN